MPSLVYNIGKRMFVDGTLDWDSANADVRIALVRNTYIPSAGHQYVSEVATHEVSGTGYVRQPLMERTVVVDNATNRVYLNANPATWGGINAGTISGALVYLHLGANDAANPLIAFLDLPDIVTDGTDLSLSWPSGLLYLV